MTVLPPELWTKILKNLKISDLVDVQYVCKLFWDIVQDFVSHGDLKTDFYTLRRPFEEVQNGPENYFVCLEEDRIYFRTKTSIWILGN